MLGAERSRLRSRKARKIGRQDGMETGIRCHPRVRQLREEISSRGEPNGSGRHEIGVNGHPNYGVDADGVERINLLLTANTSGSD